MDNIICVDVNYDDDDEDNIDVDILNVILEDLNLVVSDRDIQHFLKKPKFKIIKCEKKNLESVLNIENNNLSAIYTNFENIFDVSKKITYNLGIIKKKISFSTSINILNYLKKL